MDYMINNNGIYSVIKNNGEIFPEQFKWIGCFDKNIRVRRVKKLNGKENYIKEDCTYLSDIWFDKCDTFEDGFAVVELNGKENYIKSNGTLLSDQWFDCCSIFKNGLGMVALDNDYEYKYITENNILLDYITIIPCIETKYDNISIYKSKDSYYFKTKHFFGTVEEFEKTVKETYGKDSEYYKEYMKIINEYK